MSLVRKANYPVQGVGLGLRRVNFDTLADQFPSQIDFMEVGPENWIDVGGLIGHKFSAIAEQIPLVCHGLSLNLCPIDLPPKERLKLLLCLQSLKLSFHMTVNFRTIFLVFLNNANGYP